MTEVAGKNSEAVVGQLRGTLRVHGLELSDDGHIRWEKNNPDHPRNWPMWRKIYNTSVILFLELIT